MYKLECINDNDTKYFGNTDCNIKFKTRGIASITILTDVIKEINYGELNIEAMLKSSSNAFNSVIVNTTFEICSEIKNLPPMLKFMLPLIQKFGKNFLHECPYRTTEKQIGFQDLEIDTKLIPLVALSTLNRGEYRVRNTFSYKNGEVMFWSMLYMSIVQKRIERKKTTSSPA